MPVPITINAAEVDLSPRIAASTAIVGSPAAAAETIICSLTLNTDLPIISGVALSGWAAFTVGTNGTAVTFRLRRTNASGTVVATSGALTGGVAATNLLAQDVKGFDTGAALTGQVYVLTMQVTAGSAISTVSAVFLKATIV